MTSSPINGSQVLYTENGRPDQLLTAACYQKVCSAHQTVYRQVPILCWTDGTWHYAVLYEDAHKTGGRVRGEGGAYRHESSMCCGCRGVAGFVVEPESTVSILDWAAVSQWTGRAGPSRAPKRACVCVCVYVGTALKYLTTAGLETFKLLPSGDNSASIKFSFKPATENQNSRNYKWIV